ncbi:MAG TPA: hypothetical protein VLL51_10995 [Gemmatimonadales bacterium]|nr:hypothetical protein [Gemmatimonadales bacterium]
MSDTLRGNRIKGKLRAPKVHDGNRVCAHKGCTTLLSRYNKRDHCYAHAPTKFPRLRGRVLSES